MIVFESALDTEAKQTAISNRKQAYIMSWQVLNQWAKADWWMINATQAMNTANAMSQTPTSVANISTWQ
jgi:hypothetical protein